MFFWNKICVTGLFFLICSTVSAQLKPNTTLKGKAFILQNSVKTSEFSIHFTYLPVAAENNQQTKERPISNIIPQDFYTSNFGFFCKQELHIEKAIKIPLRFRLGSLQQCNYYEGKK